MKDYSFEDIWQYMNDDRRMREFIQKEGINKEGFKKSLEMFYSNKLQPSRNPSPKA